MDKNALTSLLADIARSRDERLAVLKSRAEYYLANPNVSLQFRESPQKTRGSLANRFARLREEVIPSFIELLQTPGDMTEADLDHISDAIAGQLHQFALDSSRANEMGHLKLGQPRILSPHDETLMGGRSIGSDGLCRMALEFAKRPGTIAQIQGTMEELTRAREQQAKIERFSVLFPKDDSSVRASADKPQSAPTNSRLPRRICAALVALGIAYTLYTWVPIWQAERAGETQIEVEQFSHHNRAVLKVSEQQWRYLDELGIVVNDKGFSPITEHGVKAVFQWSKTLQPEWKTLRTKSEGKIGLIWLLLCPVALLLWFR